MPQRIYIETTFVSYLTARASRDVVIAGHQQITHEWWDTCRRGYELCASQLVLREAGAGDPQAAQDQLAILATMVLLETTAEALALAKVLLQAGALPAKAGDDALHIAIAASQGVPYLLTWICRHMANATMRPLIESVCAGKGYKAPIICTPEELLEPKPRTTPLSMKFGACVTRTLLASTTIWMPFFETLQSRSRRAGARSFPLLARGSSRIRHRSQPGRPQRLLTTFRVRRPARRLSCRVRSGVEVRHGALAGWCHLRRSRRRAGGPGPGAGPASPKVPGLRRAVPSLPEAGQSPPGAMGWRHLLEVRM